MDIQLNAFSFYFNWYEAAQKIEDEKLRLEFLEAIIETAFSGEVPEISNELKVAMDVISFSVLKNREKNIYELERKSYGGRNKNKKSEVKENEFKHGDIKHDDSPKNGRQLTNKECYESYFNGSLIESTAIELKVELNIVKSKLNEFHKGSKPFYPNIGDYVFHFKNWFLKRKNNAVNIG